MCRGRLCWWIQGVSVPPHGPCRAGGRDGAGLTQAVLPPRQHVSCRSRNALGKGVRRGGFTRSSLGRPSVTHSCLSIRRSSWFLFCTQPLIFARAEEIELFLRLFLSSLRFGQNWPQTSKPADSMATKALAAFEVGQKGNLSYVSRD